MAYVLRHWRESASLVLVARSAARGGKNAAAEESQAAAARRFSCDYEVLVIKRSPGSSFMPGALAFPGGAAHDSDFSALWLDLLRRAEPSAPPRRPPPKAPMLSRPRDPGHPAPSDVAFRICAIRETFEETGVLLARGTDPASRGTARAIALPPARLETWRARVRGDASEFAKMCLELGVVPDLAALYEWANWLTPVGRWKRFDTMFYVGFVDRHPQVLHDGTETVAAEWCSPADILASYLGKQCRLPPPQFYHLSQFLNFPDPNDLSRFVFSKSERAERWLPVKCNFKDSAAHLLPGDDLYPKEPDLEGNVNVISLPYARAEQEAMSKYLHRFTLSKDGTMNIACSIPVSAGHLAPVTDLASLLGIKAMF